MYNFSMSNMGKYVDKYVDDTHIDMTGFKVASSALDIIMALCKNHEWVKKQTLSDELHFYCPVEVPGGELRTLHLVF